MESITWHAPEFEYSPKGKKWLLIVSVTGVVLAIILFFIGQWLGALIPLASIFVFYRLGNLAPRTLTYTVSDTGVDIQDRHFSYDDFKAFWLDESLKTPTLFLQPKRLGFALSLPLDDKIKPETICQLLRPKLLQKEKILTFVDILHRLTGL